MENSTLLARLKASFKLIFANLGKYIGYNFVIGVISLFLALIFIGIGGYLIYLHSSVATISVSVVLILFGLRIISAFSWLINYFLTNKLYNKEEVSLKKAIKFCFGNLWNKAVVDFWYFILILFVLSLVVLFILVISFLPYSIKSIASILIIIFGFALMVYVLIKYAFSYYHCFDNHIFSWRQFMSSGNLVKGRFWSVVGNLLVAFIIAYLLLLIVQLIGSFIMVILSHGVSFEQLVQHFVGNLRFGVKPDFALLVLLGGYLIIRTLGALFYSLYFVAYTYIYYRFLKDNEDLSQKKD